MAEMNVENTLEVIDFLREKLGYEESTYIVKSLEDPKINVSCSYGRKHFCIVHKDKDGTLQSAYAPDMISVYNAVSANIPAASIEFRNAIRTMIMNLIHDKYAQIATRFLSGRRTQDIYRAVPS